MKVVDASSMIDLLTSAERSAGVAAHFVDDLFAPELLILEVQGFLRRMVTAKRLRAAEADDLAARLHTAPIEYSATWPYAAQVWAWRHDLSPYDAAYVALAVDLRCPLLTTDLRLGRAATDLVPIITV